MRHHEDTLWSEIGVDQFSFLRDQDESFRAKWGTPQPLAAAPPAPTEMASGAAAGGTSVAPSRIVPLPEVHNREQAA